MPGRAASRPGRREWLRLLAVAAPLPALASCAAGTPSTLDPAGFGARRAEGLWWLLCWVSVAVLAEVLMLLGWALWWRSRATTRVRRGDATRFVTVFGVGLPFVILIAVYGVGLRDLAALGEPAERPAVTVEVIGHRWWWEIRYPDTGAILANEIHVPVGGLVRVELRTADVTHSFWVPQLMPKTDLIAGRVNETWLRAERPGSFRGQCAEYCGLQHAFMALMVVAQPKPEFETWLTRSAAPAPTPRTAAQQRGLAVFERNACASCHTVRGTTANGTVGPDLTTVASRWSLGAGAVDNTPGHLGGWIVNPQQAKPGSAMPPQPIAAGDLPDLLAYLESLT